MKAKRLLSICLLAIPALLLAACGPKKTAAPKVVPNFTFTPPSHARVMNMTAAVVSIQGRMPQGGLYQEFKSAARRDLEAILNAKGLKIAAQVDSLDELTYRQKKAVDFIFIPKLDAYIKPVVTDTSSNFLTGDVTQKGMLVFSGALKLDVVEPLSGEKVWTKRIKLDEAKSEFTKSYHKAGGGVPVFDLVGAFRSHEDTRNEALVQGLNKTYKNMMKKAWSYIDPEELAMVLKDAKELKSLKRY